MIGFRLACDVREIVIAKCVVLGVGPIGRKVLLTERVDVSGVALLISGVNASPIPGVLCGEGPRLDDCARNNSRIEAEIVPT